MDSSSFNTAESYINPSLSLDNSFSYSSSLGTEAFRFKEWIVKFDSYPFTDS
jgi:hypothetical protein